MQENKSENKFFVYVRKILELMGANALWIIACIPLFTIGPASAALFYTIRTNLIKDREHVWTAFRRGFRSNFKQGLLLTLIMLGLLLFLYGDSVALIVLAEQGKLNSGLSGLFYALMALVFLYFQWVFVYLSKYENTIRNTLKNVLFIALINLPTTLYIAVLWAAGAAIMYLLWPTILVLPGVIQWLICVRVEKVFDKYERSEEETEEEKTDS
jgi:uncharacterized membrane protein YesL